MAFSPWFGGQGLRHKLWVVYFLMFLLPVAFLLVVIWDLVSRAEIPQEPFSFLVLSLKIGVPAAAAMSLAALALMYRSVRSLIKVTRDAEVFFHTFHGADAKAGAEGDEVKQISFYVTDMILELRQRLTDVDRYVKELNEANRKLAGLAIHDGLTGLFNHRHLKEMLATEFARSVRFSHPLSVLMIDIDDFKGFNDTHGHLGGDAALCGVANSIQSVVRQVDVVARYGGEEFFVILPETSAVEALEIAERIRAAVEAQKQEPGTGDGSARVTASIGVGVFPGPARTFLDLIEAADRSMYAAKRAGKNRIVRLH